MLCIILAIQNLVNLNISIIWLQRLVKKFAEKKYSPMKLRLLLETPLMPDAAHILMTFTHVSKARSTIFKLVVPAFRQRGYFAF